MVQLKVREWIQKYRYVLLILLAGMVLMLLPGPSDAMEEGPEMTVPQAEDPQTRLERILSRIQGAGEVAVMLTEESGEQIIYQTDGDGADTVLISDASRNEQGLVRMRQPPVYRGAIVVCAGADSAAVRLAITEAVANVTGLGMDKITVLKME